MLSAEDENNEGEAALEVIPSVDGENASSYEDVLTLELFHTDFDPLKLKPYRNIQKLIVFSQNIEAIQGLDHLEKLEQLWLCESKISKIEGLQNCTRLKKLFLYSNCIEQISGLNFNTSLEVLWLSDNKISHIENLQHLSVLKELNLANNQIRYIGKSLNFLKSLKSLNLSGNLLFSFSDLFNLIEIKSLSELVVNSPDYAPMNICCIPNYSSMIIYYMPFIQILDGIDVSDEAREMVKMSIERRLCYYGTKIQAINRNRNILQKLIQQHTNDQFHKLVLMMKKSIEPFITNGTSYDDRLKGLISHHESEMQLQTTQYFRIELEINTTCDTYIRLFSIEYQMAGLLSISLRESCTFPLANSKKLVPSLAFEFRYWNDGGASSQWDIEDTDGSLREEVSYITGTIVELVMVLELQLGLQSSVMTKSPMKEVKIEKPGWVLVLTKPNREKMMPFGVQFNQLANGWQCRYLIHFSSKDCSRIVNLQQLTFKSMLNEVTNLDFLSEDKLFRELGREIPKFFLDESIPAKGRESDSMTLSTFKSDRGSLVLRKFVGAVELTSSDCVFENLDFSFSNITKVLCSGQILHLKRLYLNYCNFSELGQLKPLINLTELECRGNKISCLVNLTSFSKYPFLKTYKSHNINANILYITFTSVTKLVNLDLRYNEICFKRSYSTVVLNCWPLLNSLDGRKLNNNRSSTSPPIYYNMTPINPSLEFTLINGNIYQELNKPVLTNIPNQLDCNRVTVLMINGVGHNSNLEQLLLSVWNNVKVLSLRSNCLKNVDKIAMSFPSVERISLDENAIVDFAALDNLCRLKFLSIARNRIQYCTRVEGMTEAPTLEELNLNENNIKTCDWIARYSKLRELHLACNKIKDQHQIHQLRRLARMIVLDINGNPVCFTDACRLFTIYHIPNLKVLNNVVINAEEATDAQKAYYGQLTIEFLYERLGRMDFQELVSLDLSNSNLKELTVFQDHTIFQNLQSLNLSFNQISYIEEIFRFRKLKSVCANNNSIQSIQSVATSNILELRLAYNNIDSIRLLSLERVPNLQVLDLQGNRLKELDHTIPLPKLKILNLDKNFISNISSKTFIKCTSLESLSARENRLRQTYQLGCLTSLKFLALSNNRIQDVTEFSKMQCSNLLDLTFSSNPIETEPFVKYYIITFLPNLQRINGRALTPLDFEKAKEIIQATGEPQRP